MHANCSYSDMLVYATNMMTDEYVKEQLKQKRYQNSDKHKCRIADNVQSMTTLLKPVSLKLQVLTLLSQIAKMQVATRGTYFAVPI